MGAFINFLSTSTCKAVNTNETQFLLAYKLLCIVLDLIPTINQLLLTCVIGEVGLLWIMEMSEL